MGKRNIGKVKRYKRSFYTGKQWAMKIAGGALAVALLFGLGYLVGPAVIDFGTHTWYTQIKGADLTDDSAASEPVTAESLAVQEEPVPTPAPTPEPTPVPEMMPGNWGFAALSGLTGPERIAATVQAFAEQGVQYVVIPLKDSSGYIYYNSAVEAASGSVAATTIDAAAVAEAVRAAGLTPVASLCMFQDPLSPYTDRSMGIHYRDGEYFWLDAAQDAGGKPWLNPCADPAVDFLSAIIAEVRAMGYRDMLLSAVQFPTRAGENCNYGEGANPTSAQLAAIIDGWQSDFAAAGGSVWFQYPLATVASVEAVTALQGVYADLGVKNLLISLPVEAADKQEEMLAAACAAAQSAGTEHIVVKSGDAAGFR